MCGNINGHVGMPLHILAISHRRLFASHCCDLHRLSDAGGRRDWVSRADSGAQTRTHYNEVYRSTNDEQILLNIVRLRYADSPVFVDLPNITSQFEVAADANYLGGKGNQFPGPRRALGLGALEFAIRRHWLSSPERAGNRQGAADAALCGIVQRRQCRRQRRTVHVDGGE